jgi:very-short-patch-repair endonuclease/DNA polymerase III delta prime subunit
MNADDLNVRGGSAEAAGTAPLQSHDDERVAATIGNWKRKLLDVSKRNRALNFKPNKVTTVNVVDEQPAEVFCLLYLREQQMRFLPAPPKAEDVQPQSASATTHEATAEDDSEDYGASPDFTPYAASALDARHTDDFLQTAATAEDLDKSLRRIADQAQASLEEQGVNTLFLALGMLHYKESAASQEVLRAPLVLLPVSLQRKSARTGYTLAATDDDPIVNPALAEYLRRSFGITLPDLPELTNLPEQYDLQQLFAETAEAVKAQGGWHVKTEIALSFFSFQKFVMYKDLEVNAAAFGAHALVRQIVLRSGESLRALPEEVRAAELDGEFPPESTAQVVNADSSQLRAILAVSRKNDLVLEGPPGTGKSQTITNLIAQALSENKSVLFVAEKMAALEVVHARLVEAGLGEFCLELHSTKANKRAVMQELASALDASLQRPRVEESATARIAAVREELTAYARAAHEPFGALALSPYRAYGELEKVLAAPKLRLTRAIADVTGEELEMTERDLRDLAEAAQPVGDPSAHPWRDTTRTFYSEQDLDDARELLDSLRASLTQTTELAARAQNDFSLPAINTFADVRAAASVTALMARSPGAPLAVLQSEAWNSAPPAAVDLVKRGRALGSLRAEIESKFNAGVLDEERAGEIEFVEAKENGPLRFLNFLSGRFRAIKSRWLGYRAPSYQPTLIEQAADMRKVEELRRERDRLRADDAQARALFGALWQGEGSDWGALEAYINWVVEFRGACVRDGLREQALTLASRPHPDVSVVERLREESEQSQLQLNELRAHVGWPGDYLYALPLTEIAARAEALFQNLRLAPRWAAFELARAKVASGLAAELLDAAMRGEVAFADLAPAFRRAFLQRWLGVVFERREPLRRFNTLTHEQRVAEFRALDERVLTENRAELVRNLRDRVQTALRTPEAVEAMRFLRPQLTRQRGLSPLRTTFQKSYAAIRAIKPVFLMSPLTAAQLLDGRAPGFDLVIFDEASQLPAEDAVGAIARGRQLVVVGDPKQLPPTNFFSVMSGTVAAPVGEDGTPLFEDSESILEEFAGSGAPMTRLKWHYRSAHESLINFSNVSFYDSDLYTFPSVETDSRHAGLSFEYVADGVYEGKGLNMTEARRVADAVMRFAKEQAARRERGEAELSLGVGTFNLRQQLAVQDELEVRRRQDASTEWFFTRGRREPFFVKNLENIQGDERDVIFLSVTYAKDANGVLRYNFGPLNGENGWRRLNVLTTRARQGMRVFSSMKGDEINPAHATSQGPQLLRSFLLYAERGQLDSTTAAAGAQTESPFEREVFNELTRRGLLLQPQVGVAGYRIDFGVRDEETPGRYLCGIECDGAAYHSSETARDRDRLRQQVLEARGWTIHRLWSTDWFKDRNGQIERLLGLVEATRRKAREDMAAEREARERLAALEREGARPAQEEESKESEVSKESPAQGEATPAPPAALPYVFAETPPLYAGQDFHTAPASFIGRAIEEAVMVEAPLHVRDLAARVVALWGYEQVSSKMLVRVRAVAEESARQGCVRLRGDFAYRSDDAQAVTVRSRAGTKIPPERISPEEYRAAVLLVLRAGDGVERKALVNSVRSLFGFGRTGTNLDTHIGSAIEELLAAGIVGEGSTGLSLRA